MARKKNDRQLIIERWVEVPDTQKRVFWAKEQKFLTELLQDFPDIDFWLNSKVDFKLKSLCWLLGKDGCKYLEHHYSQFFFNPKISHEEYKIYDKTYGESIKKQLKPKNLRKWLSQK